MDAVSHGDADCFIVKSSEMVEYVKNHKLQSFILTKPRNASFAVKHGNSILLSILNKTLKTMSTSKLSGVVNMYDNDLKKVTIVDFIRNNLLIVSITVGVIVLIVF